MGRRPIDRISQERLVYELRVAIDRYRRRPSTTARDAIMRLIAENPRSIGSKHVTYNLGKARVALLRQLDATGTRSFVPDKVAQGGDMVRENPELQKAARPKPLDIKEDRTPAQLRRDGDEPRVIKGDATPTTKKG